MFLHQITIDSKYKYNNQVIWYTDTYGNRYTTDDIIFIIKNGVIPKELSVIYGYGESNYNKCIQSYKVKINMILTKNNQLRCTNRTLSIKSVLNNKPICVINEDSKSGYILCRNLLIRTFPNVYFHFYTSGGNTQLFNTVCQVINKYSYYIIVTDNKEASKTYLKQLNDSIMLLLNNHKKLAHLKPLSIEEMLLSWVNLPIKPNISSVYHNIMINYYLTGNKPYSYLSNDNYKILNYRVHNLEETLFLDFTKCSLYTYSKAFLSHCFYSRCCIFTLEELNCNYSVKCAKAKVHNSDALDISNNSLFSVFYNIINGLIGGYEDKLKWSGLSKNNLYIIRG